MPRDHPEVQIQELLHCRAGDRDLLGLVLHPEDLPVLLHGQVILMPEVEVDRLDRLVDHALVGSHDHDVVHISSHVADVQLLHDVVVERLQQEVAEPLAGVEAQRKTFLQGVDDDVADVQDHALADLLV